MKFWWGKLHFGTTENDRVITRVKTNVSWENSSKCELTAA